jgi:hypothetical protein
MMMRRRMLRPRVGMGVVGAMATTAAVVGTAGAVSHHQQQKYANQAQQQAAQQAEQQAAAQQQQDVAEMQQQMAALQAQQAQAAAQAPSAPSAEAPPATPAGDGITAQLNQLAQLRASGVLTDAEFTAAKAKLLAAG